MRAGLEVDAGAILKGAEPLNVKLAALSAYNRAAHPDKAETLVTWLKHPAWQVRAAATDYLIEMGETVDPYLALC